MEKITPLHIYRVILFTSSIFIVGLLWRNPILVFFILLLLLIELNRTLNWRYLKTSLICTFFGPIAEAIAIAFKAWTYNDYQVIGVPVWLAPLWGIACLFFISTSLFLGEIDQPKEPRKRAK